ncbi:MAG: hypothetical protein EOP06_01760 [Proteobacteria bacterium]|nr:MAG: hypothetical protein EOP06_01760 [Pseudomonadota bacterium]
MRAIHVAIILLASVCLEGCELHLKRNSNFFEPAPEVMPTSGISADLTGSVGQRHLSGSGLSADVRVASQVHVMSAAGVSAQIKVVTSSASNH